MTPRSNSIVTGSVNRFILDTSYHNITSCYKNYLRVLNPWSNALYKGHAPPPDRIAPRTHRSGSIWKPLWQDLAHHTCVSLHRSKCEGLGRGLMNWRFEPFFKIVINLPDAFRYISATHKSCVLCVSTHYTTNATIVCTEVWNWHATKCIGQFPGRCASNMKHTWQLWVFAWLS